MTLVAGVDIGKTTCRVQLCDSGRRYEPVKGLGAHGLAELGGVEQASGAIVATLSRALSHGPNPAGAHAPIGCLAVGAAGAEAAPRAVTKLAAALASRLPVAEVAIASDSLTAHVGALHGQPGVVLVVGTGSVALGVSGDGRICQVGGWGPFLGDDGSGAWIGRQSLRAVLRAHEGRGEPTALVAVAERRYGELSQLPLEIGQGGTAARTAAAFAPDVLACAEAGDHVAADVVRRAADVLAELTSAAVRAVGERRVAVVGGLAGATRLIDAWRSALAPGLEVVPASGTALAGALALAVQRHLPHESRVLRWRVTPAHVVAAEHKSDREPTRHVEVDVLATEQARPELADLDLLPPEDVVHLLLEAEATVPAAVAQAQTDLAAAVRLAASAITRGGRLVYVGAGTPGRLATVDAAECPPTFGTSPEQVVAVLAGGGQATSRAVEGVEDDAVAGARDVTALGLTDADVVVGITASGRTPYVLAALDAARRQGCATVAIVNNPDSPARSRADVTVELLTGAEVVAGSTRLKAGTAQKMALNALSTSAFVAAGKTYGGWMVDVVASNEKLRRRARRIVREATGVEDTEALRVLGECDWHPKTAIVAVLAGVDAATARQRLATADGRVRDAVGPGAAP